MTDKSPSRIRILIDWDHDLTVVFVKDLQIGIIYHRGTTESLMAPDFFFAALKIGVDPCRW